MVWGAFGFAAFRNVVPSALLIAPVTVRALDRTRWGDLARAAQSSVSPRESAVVRVLLACGLIIGVATIAPGVTHVRPLERTPALRIARWVAAQGHPIRIFNAYNASGALALFGGGNARLVVDGRADMWGGRYIDRMVGAEALKPGWEPAITSFRPEAVVTGTHSPLATLLTREGTWRLALRDGEYVLLLPTGSGART